MTKHRFKLWFEIDPMVLAKFRGILVCQDITEEEFLLKAIRDHLEEHEDMDRISGAGLRQFALEQYGLELDRLDLAAMRQDLTKDFHYFERTRSRRPVLAYALSKFAPIFAEMAAQKAAEEQKKVKKKGGRPKKEVETEVVDDEDTGPRVRGYQYED